MYYATIRCFYVVHRLGVVFITATIRSNKFCTGYAVRTLWRKVTQMIAATLLRVAYL